jgi:hypothetical protein
MNEKNRKPRPKAMGYGVSVPTDKQTTEKACQLLNDRF